MIKASTVQEFVSELEASTNIWKRAPYIFVKHLSVDSYLLSHGFEASLVAVAHSLSPSPLCCAFSWVLSGGSKFLNLLPCNMACFSSSRPKQSSAGGGGVDWGKLKLW